MPPFLALVTTEIRLVTLKRGSVTHEKRLVPLYEKVKIEKMTVTSCSHLRPIATVITAGI